MLSSLGTQGPWGSGQHLLPGPVLHGRGRQKTHGTLQKGDQGIKPLSPSSPSSYLPASASHCSNQVRGQRAREPLDRIQEGRLLGAQNMVKMCEEWCFREEKWKFILISSVEANLKFLQIPTCLMVRWVTIGFNILLSGWFMLPYEGYSISVSYHLRLGTWLLSLDSYKATTCTGLCAWSRLYLVREVGRFRHNHAVKVPCSYSPRHNHSLQFQSGFQFLAMVWTPVLPTIKS